MAKTKEDRAAYLKKWNEDHKEHLHEYRANNAEIISIKQKERRAEKLKEDPNHFKDSWQEWYKNNKIRSPKRRFTEAKHSAKKRKIEWTLTLDEYAMLIIMPCYYCANELGEPVRRSIGLDRLNSDLGYELNNVVSCCYLCNVVKGMFLTQEEMILVAKTLIDFRRSKKLSI